MMTLTSTIRRGAQRGVSMLFALCALAVLTLGAVALVRSVDTGMLVLGNLGFKKDAVSAASLATESAITWLQNKNNGATLNNDDASNGYYASSVDNLDPTGATLATATGAVVLIDWDNNGCKGPGTSGKTIVCRSAADAPASGDNAARYVIVRLCRNAGANDGNNSCVWPIQVSGGGCNQKGALLYGKACFGNKTSGIAYRILARTVGTRGTVAYTETLVHF